jgi:MFS family permease
MVLFWQDNGLSLTQVMILQALFAITVVFLEVPSGYFADIIGRRKTLFIAGNSLFFAVVVYSAGHNFYHFLIAEMLFACGISLISGSDSALIYDTLQEIDEAQQYQEVYGKVYFYHLVALAFSNVSGGFLATINFRVPFYVTAFFFLFLSPTAFSLQEPPRKQLLVQKGYWHELFKIIKYSFVQDKKLRWLIIYSGVILGLNQAVLWFYQPYFKLAGLDIAYFGIVFASFQIVAAMSSKYAYKIERILGSKLSLFLLAVFVGASYFLMGHIVFLFSFSFAFLQQFVRGFSRIVITDYVNQLTESDIRATVLSVQNLMARLFYAMIIPFAGRIADLYGIIPALKILGWATVSAGTLMLIILHKDSVL